MPKTAHHAEKYFKSLFIIILFKFKVLKCKHVSFLFSMKRDLICCYLDLCVFFSLFFFM